MHRMIAAVFLFLGEISVARAAVCIQPPVRVRHLQGRAVYESKSGLVPLKNVPTRIRVKRVGLVGEDVATAVTDEDGRFSAGPLPPGRYTLLAEPKVLSPISADLIVKRSWFWQRRDRREVLLVFGFDPADPCGGSWVQMGKPSLDR